MFPSSRTIAVALGLILAGALAGCESPAGEVSVLQSSSVPIAAGSTYAFAPISDEARAHADPRVSNDIIQERLRTAIQTALAAKGYREVGDPGQATLVVSYHVGLQQKQETRVDTFGGGGVGACGFRGCAASWGFYGPPKVNVQNIDYTQGTLILDLVDRGSGKLAWRGTSRKRINEGDADQAKFNAVLAEVTKSLPGTAAPKS